MTMDTPDELYKNVEIFTLIYIHSKQSEISNEIYLMVLRRIQTDFLLYLEIALKPKSAQTDNRNLIDVYSYVT